MSPTVARVLLGTTAVGILAAGYYWQPRGVSPESGEQSLVTADDKLAESDCEPLVLYESASYVFACHTRICAGGDSNYCYLEAISRATGMNALRESMFVDDIESSILLSPDKEHVLVIQPGSYSGLGVDFIWDKATVIETDTAAHRDIYVAEPDTSLGILTALPAFLGRGQWIDNTHVSLNLYSTDDNHTADPYFFGSDEESRPIRTLILTIE